MTVERHYYHCSDCGSGFHPEDESWHLDSRSFSSAVREVIALLGTEGPFTVCAKKLAERLCQLIISESSVQRITEEAADMTPIPSPNLDQTWDFSCDAHGQSVAYIQVDATGVPLQGPKGAKSSGAMVYVGAILNRADDDGVGQAKYEVSYHELAPLGGLLRTAAARAGVSQAKRCIGLSDGGSGLEEFFERNFPGGECILDFYHATTYLQALSKALGGAVEERLLRWCHVLKHQGVTPLLSEWDEFEESWREQAEVWVEYARARRYVENNRHRMDYPRYLAEGLWIGSGAIEASCKHVINQRLKQSGMRWGERGAEAMARLRARFRSTGEEWDELWWMNRHREKTYGKR